jgi:light-regulated signal transduction histidine kinase (bacteriophytochrome)
VTDFQPGSVDLDRCADEPIHIPGSIQPHGVLVGVSEPDLIVRVVSTNCADLFGVDATGLLGRPLREAVAGGRLSSDLEDLPWSDHPTEEFSMSTTLLVDGRERTVDAVLHRTDELLVIEIEPEAGTPPSARTFQLTRASISRIHRSKGLDALYQVAVEEMSTLTGFDRVMLYRFDADWNGEVVAEVRRHGDLTSFLGLHYPASDIPAQARRLYRSNWLRLIVDVDYVPVPLVPQDHPLTGRPLDLSHAGLRSVSPVHLEYQRNLGVAASMSVSLLDDGELWGLIACHHYRGPRRPSYEIRAAAVFLGQTLSLRLVETERRESERRVRLARSTLATLTAAALDESRPAAVSLVDAERTLLDLVPAAGAAVSLEGIESSVGVVPSPVAARALVARARTEGVEVMPLSQVPDELATVDEITDRACGSLVMSLPDNQYVVWCRPELIQTVSWGGDPRSAEAGLAAYAVSVAEIPARALGWAYAANTGAIVCGQLVALRLIGGRRRSAMLALCAATWSVSWLVIASADVVDGWVAVAAIIVGLGLFGAGETLWAPVAPAIVNDLAREDMRGRYNALQGMTWTVGSIVGPASAGLLIGHGHPHIWVACVVGGTALAAVLFLDLRRHLTDAQDGIAVPA